MPIAHDLHQRRCHDQLNPTSTSIAMGPTLRDCGIMASMVSKGDPWDNVPAESCISTIKNELVKRRTVATQDQAMLAARPAPQ